MKLNSLEAKSKLAGIRPLLLAVALCAPLALAAQNPPAQTPATAPAAAPAAARRGGGGGGGGAAGPPGSVITPVLPAGTNISQVAPGCWPAGAYTGPTPIVLQPPAAPAAGNAAAGRGGGGGGGRGGAAAGHQPDPRECLSAGLYNAGEAAKNMTLVAFMHQPEGMYDPQTGPGSGGLSYANSDLAFGKDGKMVVQGNFHGLILWDVSDPTHPKLQTVVACDGGQGDPSVYGNLAFMSVEGGGKIDCSGTPASGGGRGGRGRGAAAAPGAAGTPPAAAASNLAPAPAAAAGAAAPAAAGGGRGAQPADPTRARGVRIFDISDPLKVKQVAMVQTCRGSHTHTIVVDPKDKDNIYLYVSGTSGVRSPEEMAGCDNGGPTDPHTSSYGIDVIKVPLAHPEQSKVVNHAYIFADSNTGAIDGLVGRAQGTGEPTRSTVGCHDVTSYPYVHLLGGACAGNGILLDITDVVHPKRLDDYADPAFSFWHSATFNNDGTKVLFSDEWGGGQQPKCRPQDPPNWGGDVVMNIEGTGDGRHMHFDGYYKMPAWQTDQENCVAHNGGLIPIPDRDVMSQAFYQGGATVFDFTDGAKAQEIAYFDRGPVAADHLVTAGYWAVYYYDGYLYASEIGRGLDVFTLKPSEYLSQNEIDAAKTARREGCGLPGDLNVQCQPHYVWPASYTVARALLDQLSRDKALPQDRIDALNAAMKSVEDSNGAARKTAETNLNTLTAQLTKDAATAKALDAKRMRDVADNITKHSAELK